MSAQPTSHMRAVTMLKIPKVNFKDDFMWHKQFLYVDQINDQNEVQWRIRVYDSKPKSEKHYQNYQTSVMIRDITISIFPSLQHLYNTVPNSNEWKPRPAVNSAIYTANESGNFIIVVLSPSSKVIFSAKETEMLELLDLFRLISPMSCAAADKATRQQDGLGLDSTRPSTPSHSAPTPSLTPQQPVALVTQSPAQSSPAPNPTISAPLFGTNASNTSLSSNNSSILGANPNPNLNKTAQPNDNNSNQIQSPNNRTLTRLPTNVFSPQTAPGNAKSTAITLSRNPSSTSLRIEVDNPTAGLTDEMFSDHFALGTPPSRPTITQGQQLPPLSLNGTPLQSGQSTPGPNNIDLEIPPHPDQFSTASHFKTADINDDEEQYALSESQGNLQSSGADVTHVASSSIIKPAVTDAFRKLFALPDDELLLTCQCSYVKSVLLHGSLYITNKHLCFYSSLFGYRHQIKIPVSSVIRAESTTIGGVFGGGLKVSLDPDLVKANGIEELYIFGSLRGPTKARIISTLERVGEHINSAARAAEVAFAKAAKAEAAKAAEKEKEKAEKLEKEKVEKDEKAAAKAKKAALSSAHEPSLTAAVATIDDTTVDATDGGGDDDDDDDDDKNGPVEPPCNLPLYDQIPYPGIPPPPQPAIYVSIAEEFTPVIDKVTVNCSFSQLWDMFLCNTAPSGFPIFLKDVRKEQNIRISQWAPHTLSADKASDPNNPFAGASEYLIRQVAFNAEINAPMTPPRCDILKRQVCAIWRTNGKIDCLKLIGISSTPEAPFGKDFSVCEQFTFRPISGHDNKLIASLCLSAYFLVAIGWKLKFLVPTLKARVKSDGTGQHQEWLDFVNAVMAKNPQPTPIRPDFTLARVVKKPKAKKLAVVEVQAPTPVVATVELVDNRAAIAISSGPPGLPVVTIGAASAALFLLTLASTTSLVSLDHATKLASLIALLSILFAIESKQ